MISISLIKIFIFLRISFIFSDIEKVDLNIVMYGSWIVTIMALTFHMEICIYVPKVINLSLADKISQEMLLTCLLLYYA